MAWTPPTTRSTGELITEGIWNTDLVNNLQYLKDKLIQSGSYTGNGANDRQITTGFQCRLVICQYSDDATLKTYFCMSAAQGLNISFTNTVGRDTDLLLHATDGFIVDAGFNVAAATYNYIAFSV